MKMRIASLTILCLTLAVIPAVADINGYDNGPINGNVDAWTVGFGFSVTDSFNSQDLEMINSLDFGAWEFPGDSALSVSWSIGTTPFGSDVGNGTSSGKNLSDMLLFTNGFNFDVDKISLTGLGTPVKENTNYWMTLTNIVSASGNPIYWDENSGVGCGGTGCPSAAQENTVGTIASESFTINGTCTCCVAGNSGPDCGPPTPEPSSILLFGSGILGVAGVLRRKLN